MRSWVGVGSSVLDGRFSLESVAAGGGMAVVHRGRDLMTGKPVAIKIARDGSLDATALQRFAQEVGVLQSLDHPAIVKLVGRGTMDDGGLAKPYLAMEWLEGEELGRRLRRERLGLPEAVALGRTLASALETAHAAGIVHRDVKPGNVFLVDADPTKPKLLDFGIARVLASAGSTQTGVTVGTPRYMAPEQARGERNAGARADVFSLGCVLYECLTGARAFDGHDLLAVLARILLEEPAPPRTLEPELPAALEALVLAMLSKDAEKRPTMRDVVNALDGESIVAGRTRSAIPRPLESRPAVTESEVGIVCVVLVPGVTERAEETLVDSDVVVRHDHVKRALVRFDAAVERLADGSLVAAFARRGTARDQAALAARAALALRAILPERGVAVATGRSVAGERVPIGEALDRVAEIGRRVRAGQVLADALTAGLLDERFEVLRRGDEAELIAESERGMETRRLLGRPTPFVGRNRELRLLEASWEACAVERSARVVLVTGPAGTGKSRLRHELLSVLALRSEAPRVWIGRGDPTRTASPGYLLVDALRRALGLATGGEARAAQEQIRRSVGEHFAGEAAARITLFLAEELGAPFAEGDTATPAEQAAFRQLVTARRDAVVLGDQFRRAAEELCEAESRSRPLVLVLEDLHWADPTTIRAVDGLLRVAESAPLFVVALARPEVEESFPGLWRERPIERVTLAPLSRRAAEALAQAVLGEGASPVLVARAIDLAAGNAFYLEEGLRAVAEGDATTFPETVLAMVQSRLEAQSLAARRVLRAASIFGGAFWESGVRALLGDDASSFDGALQELVKRELVSPRTDSRFVGQRELAFRHAVVRDAAYASLTDADRSAGHLLAGRWLAEVGETDAAAIAEHIERGGDRSGASVFWQRAAKQAMSGNDLAVVLEHVARALACEPTPEQTGALLLLRAEAHRWRGQLEDGEAAALAARECLRPGTAPHYQATAEAAVQASRRGRRALAEELAESVLATPPADDARAAYLVALTRMAWLLVISGSTGAGQKAFAEIEGLKEHASGDPVVAAHVALSHAHRARWLDDALGAAHYDAEAALSFTEAGDLRAACNQEMNVGFGHLALGRLEDAERALRAALATARSLGLRQIVATTEHNLGLVVAFRGDPRGGLALETRAIDAFAAMGDTWYGAFALVYRSLIHSLAEQWSAAEEDARAALERSSLAMQTVYARAALAQALLGQGRAEEALGAADAAANDLPARAGLDEVEAHVRAVRREALEAAGRAEEAARVAAEGRAWIQGLAAKITDEPTRAAYLALPVHARLLR